MNKLFFALALLFVGMSASAQHLGTEYFRHQSSL